MITLNAIAKRLEQFGTNHFFIKSYSFGSPDDVDLDKFQDFPLMHVVYTGSDYDERTKTFSFEVYVFDCPNREEQMTINQREVVSDAQQCLEDVIADIANGGNIFLFDEDYEVTTAGITPLIDERSNLLTGALLDLTIQVPYQRDACNLPIDGVSPEGGAIAYQRRGILRVLTQDGTTDVPSVNTIKVTNGTLTDEGDGVVSIDTGGVDILGDLENVNLDDPQDHEALVYDQDTDTWINGASTKLAIRVINTGLQLPKGTPVRATGVQGDQVIVAAFNASQHDPKTFIGMLDDTLANGATGYARQTGTIYHLNTSPFEIGDILYPKDTPVISLLNGMDYMTTTPPTTPGAKIACAIVLRKHENTGRVYVRTWTPSRTLGDLDDVDTASGDGNALVYNGTKWLKGLPNMELGDLRDVQDYDPASLQDKTIIAWDTATDQWQMVPQTGFLPTADRYFLNRYDTEASTARQAADVTLTIERYLTVQADGHGEELTQQSDTPTSGNKIVRKIWHKAVSFEDSDVSTWTLVHTFADDTTYNNTIATFNALLTAATYGSIPFTLAQTWEDVTAFTGLLDTYSGAASAYSLRLLDSTYTGDAIRVRRASDNAEQDIGFSDNELDTSALATFCAGTDGFVKTWYDQANSNHLTQTTTSKQAKIYDASAGVLLDANSKPRAIGQSEAADYTGGPSLNGNIWVFATLQTGQNATTDFEILLNDSSNTSNYALATASGSTSTTVFVGITANAAYKDGQTWTLAGMTRGSVWTDLNSAPTLVTLDLSATSWGSVSYGFTPSAAIGMHIMQELILYPSDQSANRAGIESNIANHYGITI